MEGIGREFNKGRAAIDMFVGENATHKMDLVMKPQFRPGRRYLEVQRYEEMLENSVVKDDGEYLQGDTDWNQEAVIDEDQL